MPHATDSTATARPPEPPQPPPLPPYRVADIGLADFGRREINLAQVEMPGLMALRERVRRQPAPGRRPHHRLAAHDRADRRAHRDPGPPRRRGPLGVVQHLLHPGPRRRRHRRRRRPRVRLEGRDPRGVLVVHRAGPALARRRGPQHDPRRRRRRHPAGPPRGRVRARRARSPSSAAEDSEEYGLILATLNRTLREDGKLWTRIAEGIKGVTEETTTGVHRLYQRHEAGQAAVPGHQRQRLGHQVQVRQPLRLPPLAHRRHLPGHRRDDRRQDRAWCSATATSARAAPSRCGARAPGSSSPRSTPSAPCRRPWRATRSSPSTTWSTRPTSS